MILLSSLYRSLFSPYYESGIVIWLISLRERQEILVRLLPFRMVNPLWLGHLVFFNGAAIFNVNKLERPVVHYYVCL
ncbi:hypothetical protein WN944_026818 [Citrus x changshan-huyou]|uniref:Uncharacterized protein n=1 Tax=Citrus x changshan-huyou TaxID=2935761 RepID=A0AAP0Q9A2_9ROSI